MSDNRTRETREQIASAQRPKRVPLHEQKRDRLTVQNRDNNFHYRIVNDIDDRVEKFKLAGYQLAPEKMTLGDMSVENTNVAVGTGTRTNLGGGTQGVLMRIPKELWEADQKAKQLEVSRKERLMRRKGNETRDDGLIGEVEISSSK